MVKVSKRLSAASAIMNTDTDYALEDAVTLLKKLANVSFDETIEIAMRLGVDPRHADQMVRGMVSLPHGTGKTVRVAVFARGDQADAAKEAGADIVGSEELVDTVQKGDIDFDRCISTPDMMPLVGKLGKVLGPRGLMPNPKLGTVSTNVSEAVKAAKSGQIEFRVEKAGIIHAGIGKASFSETALKENISTFVNAVTKAKPSGAKGTYLKRVAISSTMGPGIKLDVSSIEAA